MIDDDELPTWCKPLEEGPISLNADTTDEILTEALSERLAALMQLYDCDPNEVGWRKLALKLALDYHPAFRTITPVSSLARGGRKPIRDHASVYSALKRMRRTGELSNIEACRKYRDSVRRGQAKPSLKTLQNILTAGDRGDLAGQGELASVGYAIKMEDAAMKVAKRLESDGKNPGTFR